MQIIENRTFDEIEIGDTAKLQRVLRPQDIETFTVASRDVNSDHSDLICAKDDSFHHIVTQGVWGASLISTLLGTKLPGPGTIYAGQSLEFRQPVAVGDTITANVRVTEKRPQNRHVVLTCECTNQHGEVVIAGTLDVVALAEKVRQPCHVLAEVDRQEPGRKLRLLIERAGKLPPIRTAIVHPCDELSLAGALDARDAGLITPLLIGPRAKIEGAATTAGRDLDGIEIVEVPHSHAAASEAAKLARDGKVQALMKGALHTDELMAAVVTHDAGLCTDRRMSHVFVIDVPRYPKPLFVTDAAVNISPTLEDKRDIVQNAIDLCRALEVVPPKVAILAAVETVSAKMRSTLDAAALCKMAQRGQIEGGILDGPLALDNAISMAAARTKHIVSDVAGNADILVAPDLEAGNMLTKELIYLAGAEAAGLVLGARVPIVLTSRSDSALSRIASCALMRLFVHSREINRP
ncbi:bifunctional enoyl-CoA hydratase/phosphate acetyltransferase [Methylovirgula sp. 4M-Z18]|nr:bifunctional enoyl-CoA hydratase/phosphate acetyltransferase [Methylovirgula sp. 4M-Z18]